MWSCNRLIALKLVNRDHIWDNFHNQMEFGGFQSHGGTPSSPFIDGFSITIQLLEYPHLWKPPFWQLKPRGYSLHHVMAAVLVPRVHGRVDSHQSRVLCRRSLKRFHHGHPWLSGSFRRITHVYADFLSRGNWWSTLNGDVFHQWGSIFPSMAILWMVIYLNAIKFSHHLK